MPQCPFNDRLSAYLDGELDSEQHDIVARHISICAECQAALNALRRISSLFAAAAQPHLSQFSLHRLHKRVDAAMEESLLHLAHILQAVAACVLIAGSLWLVWAKPAQAPQPQQAQVTTVPVAWDTSTDETSTPAAAFYLADATSQGGSADLP